MRFEHWERRLNAMVEKHTRMPHDWGRQDCVLFAADCVWALTQRDPAAPWRRAYHDEAGALRIIAAAGGLVALVESGLTQAGIPIERIPPLYAQRGDLCLVEDGAAFGGQGLGVCVGAEIVGKSLAGMERRPLAAAAIVWAIR